MSVTAETTYAARPVPLSWRHPEWWSIALSLGAWLWMLRGAHHVHSFGGAMAHWLAMTLAMMVPMALVPIRTTAARSLWRRRHRAMAAFLAGYVGLWMLFGAIASRLTMTNRTASAIAFAVAGTWQLTRAKRIALAACHRTAPIAPYGWRADRDCIRYGLMIGVRCIASCWALMLACAFSGHALAAIAIGTAVGVFERYTYKPDQRLLAASLFAAAAITLVM